MGHLNRNIGHVILETATLPIDISDSRNKIIRTAGDRVIGQGIVQEANMRNRNGRFYDSRDLFPQLTCPRTLELLSTGNMKAENGHPMSKELTRQQTIDPNNTVAVFLKFWTDGDFVMAEFLGDENEKGAAFDRELRKGRKPSWSLRALGRIEETSRGAEVKGIKLITYDRVIYPSHDKAYTQGIVTEAFGGVEKPVVQEGSRLYVDETDSGIVIPVTNESVINYIKSESKNFKTIKESFDLLYDDIELINRGTQVKLTDRAGGIFVMNLENYIHDDIMNHCCSK